MSTTFKPTEQYLLPGPPKPAPKLAKWVVQNLPEVVDTIHSLYREDSMPKVNEQVTLSLLEDRNFKVQLCLILKNYNEKVIPKKWAHISKKYSEACRDFFPGGFEDYLQASMCDWKLREVRKSHTQKVILRLKEIHEPVWIKEDIPVIKTWVFPDPPDLSSEQFVPRITRRLQKKVITSEMKKASQVMSNVAFGWNNYSQALLDRFKSSPLAQEDKWVDWLNHAAHELATVKNWKQFFIAWYKWEWRMRAMAVTKDRLNPQGNVLSRSLFRLAEPVEVDDESWPSLLYSLKKRGVTKDNYRDILKEMQISSKGDVETYAAALDLLEMEETGKSSALWGMDQRASLMRLIVIYLGILEGYRDVGLHLEGTPFDGVVLPDVWQQVIIDTILRDPDLKHLDIHNPDDLKAIRPPVKTVGTMHGFGAAANTAAYGLLGLDPIRDGLCITSLEGLDAVDERLEWCKVYQHIVDENWTPVEHVEHAKEKAKLIISSIGRRYSWLNKSTSTLRNLMNNRAYIGKELREKPLPLPVITGPFGFTLDPQPWRRSKHKVETIKSSLNGRSIEGRMMRTTYNPTPDLGTMYIHFMESLETLRTTLSFSEEVSPNIITIFDNYLTDCNGMRHLPEHHTRACIQNVEHFEANGWPLELWAEAMGTSIPARRIGSKDINPKSCFLDV